MSIKDGVYEIEERLDRARRETELILSVDGRPQVVEMSMTATPESCWAGRRRMDRCLDEGVWRTQGPGFEALREWVETYWDPGWAREAPAGTVDEREGFGQHWANQLDAEGATRKLIVAAHLHGNEPVAGHAAAFAAHGMVEGRRICLLKGGPVDAVVGLDDNCTVLPYAEALHRIGRESDPGDFIVTWPDAGAEGVCAVEGRYFEPSEAGTATAPRTSRFLTGGAAELALLLGLVWGGGFAVFGHWRTVPAVVAATVPFRGGWGSGCSVNPVSLPLRAGGPRPRRRPLAVAELRDLVVTYGAMVPDDRLRVERSMARLRNAAHREDAEDSVVDVGIALATVFADEEEDAVASEVVPERAAWHYADSEAERRRTEDVLRAFFGVHARIVCGRASNGPGLHGDDGEVNTLSVAEEVLRASLKVFVVQGLPEDWAHVEGASGLRAQPPNAESGIRSVKSDALSWSVAEQKQIDRALERVWKPMVDEAPLPPADHGATTVAQGSGALAADYRRRGIPFVVTHPGRLYAAHPKWPDRPQGGLDEHTAYYCERDVVRHMWRWRESAVAKGLIQFEAPTKPELYWNTVPDDWPQPVYSSHEPDSQAKADERVPDAREPAPRNGIEAERREERSGTRRVDAGTPPADFPNEAQAGLGLEWQRLWMAFEHEANVATNTLLHQLAAVHEYHLAERRRLAGTSQAQAHTDGDQDSGRSFGGAGGAVYPALRGFPAVSGPPLVERSAPDGPMEQTLFKAWVADVYDLWESRYRTQLKHEIRHLDGAIRPRQDVLGDLRHIRNNLLHSGIARSGEAADCEVLQWFETGDRVEVRVGHVLDFMNQMGWLYEGSAVFGEAWDSSGWCIDREDHGVQAVPRLVSVRPAMNAEQEDPRYRFEASVAFEDGVFGRTPMGPAVEEPEARAKERARKWMEMRVAKGGDLEVPGLGTVAAEALYAAHLSGEKRPAPGMWRPWVRFRE